MEKPVFFTAIVKENFDILKSGQTVFFKKINDNILIVCEKFTKELPIREFLKKAIPIKDNNGNVFYYNPRSSMKAEKLMRR
jgi:hypothetical protein